MPPDTLNLRYDLAKQLARGAGDLAMRYYGQPMSVEYKGIQNVVTEADKVCEKLIATAVLKHFPGDSILGEEAGRQNEGSDTVWIIDPIDGTANFARKIPFWCVSVGIVVDLKPVVGVIYDPVREELYHSLVGRGAFRNERPIKVSGLDDLKKAHVGLGFSYRRPVEEHVRAVESCLIANCEYSRLGSGALSLAYVADGRFDGYWEGHMNSWDATAGLALVKEAEGWTSDFFADDGLNSGNSTLAATPALAHAFRRLFSTNLGTM
jgi:myo-inositol-1(or 4)-monophosphatase